MNPLAPPEAVVAGLGAEPSRTTPHPSVLASEAVPAEPHVRRPRRRKPSSLVPQRPDDEPAGATDRARRRPTSERIAVTRGSGIPEVILAGCGAHAREWFIPALSTLHESGVLRVSALVDPIESSRDWCRRTFPEALPVSSLEAVIAPPDALVVLAAPVRFHAAQANAALKRGWHVLCASPFASSVREGAMMIAAAQRQERLLAADLTHRFFPAAHYLRALCKDHLLGPPVRFRIQAGTRAQSSLNLSPAPDKFEVPNGVLDEFGAPVLDLLAWCLGAATVKSYADDAMGGVAANDRLELDFPEDVHGVVFLSRDSPTQQWGTFVFERGIVRWDMSRPSHLIFQLGSAPSAVEGELVAGLSSERAGVGPAPVSTLTQAVAAEFGHVLRAIGRRESLRVSAHHAMHSLQVLEECYARRGPLPQPWLPPDEAIQARAYAPPPALRRT